MNFGAHLRQEAALEAHRRAAPGRVYVHLIDEPEPRKAPQAPRPVLRQGDRRRAPPVNWTAESAALCMPIGVLRDRHPETAHERETRLAAWRAEATRRQMTFERLRRALNKKIHYLRARHKEESQ